MSEQHFKAPTKYPYNLTDEQIAEAFDMHYNKQVAMILNKLQTEFPLLDLEDDPSVLDLLKRTIEISITVGMDTSVNSSNVISEYRAAKKAAPAVTTYEFKENMGVSGILKENGEFLMCGNAEHYMLTEDMMFPDQIRCLFFSSQLNGELGIVTLSPFGNQKISGQQRSWVSTHDQFMDPNQRGMYDDLVQFQEHRSEENE